jgi:hypothetical protein
VTLYEYVTQICKEVVEKGNETERKVEKKGIKSNRQKGKKGK